MMIEPTYIWKRLGAKSIYRSGWALNLLNVKHVLRDDLKTCSRNGLRRPDAKKSVRRSLRSVETQNKCARRRLRSRYNIRYSKQKRVGGKHKKLKNDKEIIKIIQK